MLWLKVLQADFVCILMNNYFECFYVFCLVSFQACFRLTLRKHWPTACNIFLLLTESQDPL